MADTEAKMSRFAAFEFLRAVRMKLCDTGILSSSRATDAGETKFPIRGAMALLPSGESAMRRILEAPTLLVYDAPV
jgi:hypothetical protein